MNFDNTCKFLAENFSNDFASWLLGKSVSLSIINPTELSSEPIHADSLILLESDETILHIEFQTKPKDNIPFRMADYRLRLYRLYPRKKVKQVVIYLKKSDSEKINKSSFKISGMRHEFEIIKLWDQPTDIFLKYEGLLPLAVLSKTSNKQNTLRQVAAQIEQIKIYNKKINLAASTGILAGLSLEKSFIHQVLRRDLMKESVIYQEIQQESRLEGKIEEALTLVLRLLTRRVGDISPDLKAQIEALPLTQIENLGEASMDFSGPADLVNWLQSQ